jgi:hypothetical protein
MIDHMETVERLMAKLTDALPIPARVTPELAASLRAQTGAAVPAQCAVTWIYYAGDEGGVLCKLDFGSNTGKEAFVSITHLRFDHRLPLAREISSYQKHRVKRLRRQPS